MFANPSGKVTGGHAVPFVVRVVRVEGGVWCCLVGSKVKNSTGESLDQRDYRMGRVTVFDGFPFGAVLLVGEEQ